MLSNPYGGVEAHSGPIFIPARGSAIWEISLSVLWDYVPMGSHDGNLMKTNDSLKFTRRFFHSVKASLTARTSGIAALRPSEKYGG